MDNNVEVQVLEFNGKTFHVFIENGKKYYDYFEVTGIIENSEPKIINMLANDRYEFFSNPENKGKYFYVFDELDYTSIDVLAINEKGLKRFLEVFNKYPESKEFYEFIFKKSPICYSSYKAPKTNHIV